MKKIITFIIVIILLLTAFLLLRNHLTPTITDVEKQEPDGITIFEPPERHIYDIRANYDGKKSPGRT